MAKETTSVTTSSTTHGGPGKETISVTTGTY